MSSSTKPVLKIFDSDTTVSDKVCEFVVEIANKAIQERGIFTVGLSGGSVSKFLCNGLPSKTTDWSKWRVFFCDERHVSFDDPECTYTIYEKGLMSKVPLAKEHVYSDDPSITVSEAAERYVKILKSVFSEGLPRFDLLILGMGPDGHTCSLFPGHALLKEDKVWVAPISDSPKPPPQRITLTFPVIQNSRNAVFVSCGSGKADMVQRVLEGKEEPPLPASMVRPHSGDLYWFLDQGAAAKLKNKL